MKPAIASRPRRSPKQARSLGTVGAILEAATRIFGTQGYAAATTNAIADDAGVSVGSLYEYFASKDAILVALAEAHLAESRQLLRQATAGPPDLPAMVRAVVEATVALHAAAPALHRTLTEEAVRSPAIRALASAAERRGIRWWEHYLRSRPELALRDPALSAAMVFSTIESTTHKIVIHGDGSTPRDRYVDEIVALVLGYLRTTQ